MGIILLKNIAILFGILLVIARIGGIFSPERYRKWMLRLVTDEKAVRHYSKLLILAGILFAWLIANVLGFAIMILSFIIVWMLVGGILLEIFPDLAKHLGKDIEKRSLNFVWWLCTISVVIGLYLIWWGVS